MSRRGVDFLIRLGEVVVFFTAAAVLAHLSLRLL